MPLNTVQLQLKSILDQMPLPAGWDPLEAFIAPPNPRDEARAPAAYIWGGHGDESRAAKPRAEYANLGSGGIKQIVHQVSIWLTAFDDSEQPEVDTNFPAIVDAVLAQLRNTPMTDGTQHAVDPILGTVSNLLNIGENMSWEYGAARAVADQRLLRLDAEINVEVYEYFQA